MGEKKCSRCGHPMMEGPLRLQDEESDELRIAAWWCANCHHRVWAKDLATS